MSKAVLILDKMPADCGHCRVSAMKNYYPICEVTGLGCTETGKPEWCPLKEAPERRTDSIGGDMVALGYNMALEDLGVIDDE